MRWAPTAILAIYFIALIGVVAMLTNWFRYLPSLEAMFVMRALLVPTGVMVALYVVGMKRRRLGATLMIITTAISAIVTSAAIRQAYGSFGRPALDHVEQNGEQSVRIGDRTLTYHLELINPYSTARSVLVIREGGAERRIDVPLFRRGVAAFVAADKPADWIQLAPTTTPNVLELRTSSYLREGRFHIDLTTGEAKEIR